MAKYTENFSLIKPDDEDYYDVTDFNENMDIIDDALAQSAGSADKIGQPEDSISDTVFGKLNGFISEDGKGVRIVKSIQRIASFSGIGEVPINHVNPDRCLVIVERVYNYNNILISYSYTLEADVLKVNISSSSSQNCVLGFWIIEFY